MGPAALFLRISIAEAFIGLLLCVVSLVQGPFSSDNLLLMIAIGVWISSGFMLLAGAFASTLLEKR